MKDESRRQIYMGYHSEGGNDYTVRTVMSTKKKNEVFI
jgi:hypothetical protein